MLVVVCPLFYLSTKSFTADAYKHSHHQEAISAARARIGL